MAFVEPAPKLPHELMLNIGKHAFADTALPLELILIIGEHADTRVLSVLSRTCHTLHALFALELHKRFTTDIEDIAIWAVTSHRPLLLERALTTTLTPVTSHRPLLLELSLTTTLTPVTPHTPHTPDSPLATCQDPRRDTLKRRLSKLPQSSLPVEHRKVETVKVLLSHDIIHIPRIRTSTTQSSSNRRTTRSPRIRSTTRPPSSASPITRLRWSIDGTCAAAWMEHAVRHGDLWLARRLLKMAGAKVHRSRVEVQLHGKQTLLDVARDRRYEKPRGNNVEEMIKLLVDHDPKPSPLRYPGVEEMIKLLVDHDPKPSPLLDACVTEEEKLYNLLVERGEAVARGMERNRKKPVHYRLLPNAYM